MTLELAIRETVAATIRESMEPMFNAFLERLSAAATATAPHPDDRLITTQQLADLTGTKRITWDIARLEGRGPKFIKIGRSVRYPWPCVQEYLSEHGDRVGRRGRPPKAQAASGEPPTGTETATVPVTPRRGRPPKKVVEV